LDACSAQQTNLLLLLLLACKKKCTYYDLENLDSTAQNQLENQLDRVDIIHNVGTAGLEMHALYNII
jgi:hypothetical protein